MSFGRGYVSGMGRSTPPGVLVVAGPKPSKDRTIQPNVVSFNSAMDSDWQRVMCLLDEISLRRLPKAVPSYVIASVIWRVCVLGGLFLNVFFGGWR